MDESQLIYVVSSPKEDSHLVESSEKRFFWPIQIPSMWITRRNNGAFTKPLPLYLYLVGLGGLSL